MKARGTWEEESITFQATSRVDSALPPLLGPMPKTFLLVAACFATGASELTVQPVGGARPRCFPSDEIYTRATGASKPSIKLNARSWSSHALATAIVDILLREKLGHEVQIGDHETDSTFAPDFRDSPPGSQNFLAQCISSIERSCAPACCSLRQLPARTASAHHHVAAASPWQPIGVATCPRRWRLQWRPCSEQCSCAMPWPAI